MSNHGIKNDYGDTINKNAISLLVDKKLRNKTRNLASDLVQV